MNVVRVVYERGVEATLADGCWRVTGASDVHSYADLGAVQSEVCLRALIATEHLQSVGDRDFLLTGDGRSVFGVAVTHVAASAPAEDLYHRHHIAYLLGALGYHCQRLAEVYATIVRTFTAHFARLHDANTPVVIYGHQTEPYYEFDALISAARRTYDVSRYLLWRHASKPSGERSDGGSDG